MANKFKVGDRVHAISSDPEGHIGTVVHIDNDSLPYLVKFDDWHHGHSCSLSRSDGCPDTGDSGCWILAKDLELVATKAFKPGDLVRMKNGGSSYNCKRYKDATLVVVRGPEGPYSGGNYYLVPEGCPTDAEKIVVLGKDLEAVEPSTTKRKPILRELPNTVVQVKSIQEYNELMDIYSKAGWTWCTGVQPSHWLDDDMLSERTSALKGKGLVLTAFIDGYGFFWRELGDWTTTSFNGETPEVISLDEFKIRQGLKSRYATATEAAIMGAKPLTYQDLVDACRTVKEPVSNGWYGVSGMDIVKDAFDDYRRDAMIYRLGWDPSNRKQPSIKHEAKTSKKGIMSYLKEIPARIKRLLSPGLQARYELGELEDDFTRSDKGDEAVMDWVEAHFEKEIGEDAIKRRDAIKKENKAKKCCE